MYSVLLHVSVINQLHNIHRKQFFLGGHWSKWISVQILGIFFYQWLHYLVYLSINDYT